MSRPIRSIQNKMFIFCEGTKTEPYYLRSYIDMHAKSRFVQLVPTEQTTPDGLVSDALKYKKSLLLIPFAHVI